VQLVKWRAGLNKPIKAGTCFPNNQKTVFLNHVSYLLSIFIFAKEARSAQKIHLTDATAIKPYNSSINTEPLISKITLTT